MYIIVGRIQFFQRQDFASFSAHANDLSGYLQPLANSKKQTENNKETESSPDRAKQILPGVAAGRDMRWQEAFAQYIGIEIPGAGPFDCVRRPIPPTQTHRFGSPFRQGTRVSYYSDSCICYLARSCDRFCQAAHAFYSFNPIPLCVTPRGSF